ncbi:MAG TPA: hypothetical protein VGD43_00145, partial [Micromonospora sp.]
MLSAGVGAVLGAAVGIVVAVAILIRVELAWNVTAVTAVGWLLALLSVLPSLGPDDPPPAVRLGVVDPAWLSPGTAQQLAVVTMPLFCLALGAGTGALARWLGRPTVVAALTGVPGPAMLALAYLFAGPGNSADRYQAAPYWGALLAVCSGALGSVLAAVLRWPLIGGYGKPQGDSDPAATAADGPAVTDVLAATVPTDGPTAAAPTDVSTTDQPPASDRDRV